MSVETRDRSTVLAWVIMIPVLAMVVFAYFDPRVGTFRTYDLFVLGCAVPAAALCASGCLFRTDRAAIAGVLVIESLALPLVYIAWRALRF